MTRRRGVPPSDADLEQLGRLIDRWVEDRGGDTSEVQVFTVTDASGPVPERLMILVGHTANIADAYAAIRRIHPGRTLVLTPGVLDEETR